MKYIGKSQFIYLRDAVTTLCLRKHINIKLLSLEV